MLTQERYGRQRRDAPHLEIVILLALFGALLAGASWLVLLTPTNRAALGPLLAEFIIVVVCFVILTSHDRQLPIFDAGAICIAATFVYTVVPLLGFWISDFEIGLLSDIRLYERNPSPEELGAFSWRHVVYTFSLGTAYLCVRREGVPFGTSIASPPTAMLYPLAGGILVVLAFLLFVEWQTGFTFAVSYETKRGADGIALSNLPLLLQQLTHNAYGILLILKIAVLIFLFQRFHRPWYKAALCAWLAFEVLSTAMNLGARTNMILLLLAAVLCYHRLVYPLSTGRALAAATTLLGGFLLIGFIRDYAADAPGFASILSASNEFQALFATAYDVYIMKTVENADFPMAIHFADVLRLVPQQVLPFEKLDPSTWYVIQRTGDASTAGLMFGAIAEGVVAYDWLSLIAQGAVVGLLFGAIHRWYVANCHSYLGTIAYIWLCIVSYYTFRASTFYILVWVAYRLIPTLLFLWVGALVLRNASAGIRAERQASAAPHAA